jgi:uncharacterized protein HemX
MPLWAEVSSGGTNLFANLGGILAGLSELLLAIGGGVGFVIRSRRQARRERMRTEAAASLAAQEARKALEAKLEQQHGDQIKQLENQLFETKAMQMIQVEQYKNQITDLQHDREKLLARILREYGDKNDG